GPGGGTAPHRPNLGADRHGPASRVPAHRAASHPARARLDPAPGRRRLVPPLARTAQDPQSLQLLGAVAPPPGPATQTRRADPARRALPVPGRRPGRRAARLHPPRPGAPPHTSTVTSAPGYRPTVPRPVAGRCPGPGGPHETDPHRHDRAVG